MSYLVTFLISQLGKKQKKMEIKCVFVFLKVSLSLSLTRLHLLRNLPLHSQICYATDLNQASPR